MNRQGSHSLGADLAAFEDEFAAYCGAGLPSDQEPRLALLDADNAARRAAAALYRERLAGLPIRLPAEDAPGMEQVFHLYVVEVAERDAVLAALRAAGIGAAAHYPTPVHLQPAWSHLAGGAGALPVAERLAESVLSLPCFPGIAEEQVDRVCAALGTALAVAV
jgi:dTDP-4-amino-4,6-dideoxygalactose transaminase